MNDDGVTKLAMALIKQASLDIGTERDSEARHFLQSPLFSLICRAYDLDEYVLRLGILQRSK